GAGYGRPQTAAAAIPPSSRVTNPLNGRWDGQPIWAHLCTSLRGRGGRKRAPLCSSDRTIGAHSIRGTATITTAGTSTSIPLTHICAAYVQTRCSRTQQRPDTSNILRVWRTDHQCGLRRERTRLRSLQTPTARLVPERSWVLSTMPRLGDTPPL